MAEISGVLLIDKPRGITSHDVVYKVRKLYNTKKVGHTGTLDPLATGVLVVLVGRAAKAAEYLVSDDKRYVAGIRLGLTSDTEDITGNILTSDTNIPDSDKVKEVVGSFVGDIMQTPPMYSALKVGGKKLVDLTRENITIERQQRQIHIESIECSKVSDTDYILTVECSKGTYIRTLCADIGEKLGCGAVMSSLRRERAGNFDIADAHTLEEISELDEDNRSKLIIPTESLFSALESVSLSPFYEKLARNGAEIYQKKIGMHFEVSQRVRIYGKEGFFALGEVMEFEEGSAIKPIKLFEIE